MLSSEMLIWLIVAVTCVVKANGAYLQLYSSFGDFVMTPLSSPGKLLKSSYFNKTAPIVIYAHGFNGSPFGDTSINITTGYIKNTNVNYIALDWSEEASPAPLGYATGYAFKAVPNAKKVGMKLGEAVLELIAAGIQLEQFHLIGHSLGAHLVGFAGNRVKQDGIQIPRITGLDPAGPLFSNTFVPINGLEPSSAAFVVSVHSVPGAYGTKDSVGHVDIWLNCDRSTQPGCSNSSINVPFGEADICSHSRAPLAYIESVGAPKSFPGLKAEDCQDWVENKDTNRSIIYMSEELDTRARGNFYLRTNSRKPFGLGDKGLLASNV